ncbi:hypothetical protein BLOT_011251 [Blomia tropicalis]|nr:hypothetical protein BLOT_011251 [Blomia tropicalis]
MSCSQFVSACHTRAWQVLDHHQFNQRVFWSQNPLTHIECCGHKTRTNETAINELVGTPGPTPYLSLYYSQ